MRIIKTLDGGLKVWLSPRDTTDWASRPGSNWPCSELKGRSAFAEFDGKGNLIDVEFGNETYDPKNCPSDEFNACMTDYIASEYPDHPALRGTPQPI